MVKRRTFFFDGLGVSAGVVLGPAHVIEAHGFEAEGQTLAPDEVEPEIERFREAVEIAKTEVQELGRTVTERLDAQQAAIFDAHLQLLADPLLIDRTISRIREDHRNAEFVFWNVTRDIGAQLSALGDAYFTERTHDIYDVARRVIKFLSQLKNPTGLSIPEGSIVVANDLGPSETAQLRRDKVVGFCTNAGGPTSHTAIMAKALLLPAVVGLDFVTHYVRTGDYLIVDGTEGTVILNPSPEAISYYRERVIAYEKIRQDLTELRTLPAETQDGTRIRLEANIEFSSEIEAVYAHGAEGVGLYRTEYLFIERDTLPTEEEQEESYRQVFDRMGELTVVVRTLDIGGDKLSANIPTPTEANPFLGLRALRLCLAYPDLFRTQLRPMMRAAAGRDLCILLPMVSGLEEVQSAKWRIQEVEAELRDRGELVPKQIHVGAMIEIPSAAIQAAALVKEVDFFSIGTNDLTQYTLAVDRVNKMVGHLYHETHPAVLHLIDHVVKCARGANIPVTVCGEMAGDPLLALLLVGLGVRTLSMSPTLIAPVKKAIRAAELPFLEAVAREALQITTPTEVRETITRAFNPLIHPSGEGTARIQRVHAGESGRPAGG